MFHGAPHSRGNARAAGAGPLGDKNKVVEADETFVGGKAKDRADGRVPRKEAVMSLVERDGRIRSFYVTGTVNAKTLRKVLTSQVDRASYLMTDEAPYYTASGREFGGRGTVNHSIEEFVRGGFWHTNTVEDYFAILKRGDPRRLSPRQPQAPQALGRRVRLPLQRTPRLRRGPCRRRAARHRGQATDLSAD